MKKSIAFICILAALCLGMTFGLLADNLFSVQTAAGIYYTDDWNGDTATLRLNEDGTCKYPSGDTGTWKQEGKTITVSLPATELVYTGGTIEEVVNEGKFDEFIIDVVKDGVMINDCFFEKK